MLPIKFKHTVVFLTLFSTCIFGQKDSTKKQNPLNDDAYLHPIDAMTPYTLKKGEWIYGQSLQTLPFPSWGFYGITDKLTTQIDLLPWLFGPFSELKKPIPSFNLRYRFNDQNGVIPTIAVEAMFVHFWDTPKRFTPKNISVWENGSYFHIKPVIGYAFKNKFFLNISGGMDYVRELIMQNNDTTKLILKSFERNWTPNFSIGFDFRPSKWISYHMAYTYGSTLSFVENIPRKHQFTYGFRIAPFYKNRYGILRNLRIELVSINTVFTDIDAKQTLPIPIYPYLYWQWKRKKKT